MPPNQGHQLLPGVKRVSWHSLRRGGAILAFAHQIEQVVRPIVLPAEWKERALELANSQNNLRDSRNERLSLERRKRRLIELYKEDVIDKVEFDQELSAVENRLKSVRPLDIELAEICIADFDDFQSIWDKALTDERASLLGRMAEKLFVDFRTGQLLELVPKGGFRYVLEAAQIVRGQSPFELTIGDPEGGLGSAITKTSLGRAFTVTTGSSALYAWESIRHLAC